MFFSGGERKEREKRGVGAAPAEEVGEVGVDAARVDADGDGVDVDIEDFGLNEEREHGGLGGVEDEPGFDCNRDHWYIREC